MQCAVILCLILAVVTVGATVLALVLTARPTISVMMQAPPHNPTGDASTPNSDLSFVPAALAAGLFPPTARVRQVLFDHGKVVAAATEQLRLGARGLVGGFSSEEMKALLPLARAHPAAAFISTSSTADLPEVAAQANMVRLLGADSMLTPPMLARLLPQCTAAGRVATAFILRDEDDAWGLQLTALLTTALTGAGATVVVGDAMGALPGSLSLTAASASDVIFIFTHHMHMTPIVTAGVKEYTVIVGDTTVFGGAAAPLAQHNTLLGLANMPDGRADRAAQWLIGGAVAPRVFMLPVAASLITLAVEGGVTAAAVAARQGLTAPNGEGRVMNYALMELRDVSLAGRVPGTALPSPGGAPSAVAAAEVGGVVGASSWGYRTRAAQTYNPNGILINMDGCIGCLRAARPLQPSAAVSEPWLTPPPLGYDYIVSLDKSTTGFVGDLNANTQEILSAGHFVQVRLVTSNTSSTAAGVEIVWFDGFTFEERGHIGLAFSWAGLPSITHAPFASQL